MEIRVGDKVLRLVQGDITRQLDAIAAGGGVDGAIHRAGGPAILEECTAIVAERGRLPVGGNRAVRVYLGPAGAG